MSDPLIYPPEFNRFYSVLVSNTSANCFEDCIPRPGPELSNKDFACLANCADRYKAAAYLTYGVLRE